MTVILAFVLVQIAGFAIDATWHGLVNPGFEPTTSRQMLRHLLTMHLPLYVGVVGLFAAIVAELARRIRRGAAEWRLWLALGGSCLELAGEAWHAYTHLARAPDPVVPAMLALVGLGLAWQHRRHVVKLTGPGRP